MFHETVSTLLVYTYCTYHAMIYTCTIRTIPFIFSYSIKY